MNLLLIGGLALGGLFIGILGFNIAKGTFSIAKFFGGFNIFAGGVQGKLIYFTIFAILAFGLYHQLTRSTLNYDTDYRNSIRNCDTVNVDQRVQTPEKKYLFRLQILGLDAHFFEVGASATKVVVNNQKITTTPKVEKAITAIPVETQKIVKKSKKWFFGIF
jgi:hypothetical protein